MLENKPIRSAKHLAFVRTLPCVICRRYPSEAAHVRIGFFTMAQKPGDDRTVPLCSDCHRESPYAQHRSNETLWWDVQGIDPLSLAAKIWKHRRNYKRAWEEVMLARG